MGQAHVAACPECGFERDVGAASRVHRSCQRCRLVKLALGNTKHGMKRAAGEHRLYRIHRAMLQRCGVTAYRSQKHAKNYAHVGVCREWRAFTAFAAWALANGYADNLTLDRRENAGGYEPGNCQWIPLVENSVKRRRHRILSG